MKIEDDHWDNFKEFFREPRSPKRGPGRPLIEARKILNGILWVLRSGARWRDLPDRFPSYQTCHRRFQFWVKTGKFLSILKVISQKMLDCNILKINECFIDGTFASGKNGGEKIGKTKKGKGTKIMAIADANGLPIACHIESASPHEVTLVEATIENRFIEEIPEIIIGDKAYDSDSLDKVMTRKFGVDIIAPHRTGRVSQRRMVEN